MKTRTYAALGALLVMVGLPTKAQTISVKGGTTGLGAEIAFPLTERVAIRLWGNAGTLSRSATESDVRYDAKLKLENAFVLADLHPFADGFAGGFRVTAGIAYNGNRLDLTGRLDNSTINIGNVVYNTNGLGAINARLDFDKASPYLGIGWGRTPRGAAGFGATVDLGVMFQKANVSLTGICGPALPQNTCNALQNDLRVEEAQLRDSVSDFNIYPVLSVGLSYRF